MDRMKDVKEKIYNSLAEIGKEYNLGYSTGGLYDIQDKKCFQELHKEGEIELTDFRIFDGGAVQVRFRRLK